MAHMFGLNIYIGESLKKALLVAAVITISMIPAYGQSGGERSKKNERAKKEVIALVNEFYTAQLKSDADAYERILAPEFRGVEAVKGWPSGKETWVHSARESKRLKIDEDGRFRPEAITLDEEFTFVHIYDNTAVIQTKTDSKWRLSEEELSRWAKVFPGIAEPHTVTIVAVRKNRKWQIVAAHETVFDLTSQESPKPVKQTPPRTN